MLQELHPELFDATFWRRNQQDVRDGKQADVFPYSRALRFARPDEQPEAPLLALPLASSA
jgi:isocitrate dehydrogenase kinase/phosphatase